jgi:hypothetical protein
MIVTYDCTVGFPQKTQLPIIDTSILPEHCTSKKFSLKHNINNKDSRSILEIIGARLYKFKKRCAIVGYALCGKFKNTRRRDIIKKRV